MNIDKTELKKAKQELFSHILEFGNAYNDTGIKVPMITGRYFRSGARGCKFHADIKYYNKYKRNLSRINLPALESPTRLGVSEIGNMIRFNLRDFRRYSQYKRMTIWQKIVYTILLKRLPQNNFDSSLGYCKKVHTKILSKKRKVLDTMQQL